jgi:adenylate cyclase class 2
VTTGRLKLREGLFENFLIFYERENRDGPKESNVILCENNPGSALKEVLIKSVGVLVVVDKIREIYFIDNVKFHIDVVEGARVVYRDRIHR